MKVGAIAVFACLFFGVSPAVYANASQFNNNSLLGAAQYGQLQSVKKFLSLGANVNTKKSDGTTPLIAAAEGCYPDVVKFLLAKGADVNAKDAYGRTALFYASKGGSGGGEPIASARVLAVVNALLANGAHVNAKDNSGNTALIGAAATGYAGVVKTLLAKGIRMKSAALIAAAGRSSNAGVVTVLLANNADVNAKGDKNNYDRTALMVAAAANNPVIVKLLLAKGANVNAKDANGMTALRLAAENGNSADTIRELLANGADANATDNGGGTVLCGAIQSNRRAVVQELLASAKVSNWNQKCSRGVTALMWAAENDDTVSIKELLTKGANVNEKADDGTTALMAAVQNGFNADSVKALLANGADVNARAKNGATALTIAERLKNTKEVQLLRDAGAK